MPQKCRVASAGVSFTAMTPKIRNALDHTWREELMIERINSVTHGTCALGGRHTDPTTAAECPVLRKQRRANLNSSEQGPATSLQGIREGAPSSPEKSTTSDTVFRYSRAGKSGRPRIGLSEQRRKARERVRAYRDRRKKAVI
jgi:hypothetical protein